MNNEIRDTSPRNIVQHISVLYELSLAISKSLDIEENCNYFINTLMARKKLGYAAVWIKNRYLANEDDEKASLVYAVPEFQIKDRVLPLNAEIFNVLHGKNYFSINSNNVDFVKYVNEKKIDKGTMVIIPLGEIGLIKIYSTKVNYVYDDFAVNQFSSVMKKFAVSLEGCLNHQRLKKEVEERKKVEREMNRILYNLEAIVENRTEKLSKVNERLRKEVKERKKVETILLRQNEYLNLLHEMALGLINKLDADILLQSIINKAARMLGTSHGFIYQISEEETVFECTIGLGFFEKDIGKEINIDKNLMESLGKHAQARRLRNDDVWLRTILKDTTGLMGKCTIFMVPLTSKNQAAGILGLAFYDKKRKFIKEERNIMTQFAEIASIALDNASLHFTLYKELLHRQKTEKALIISERKTMALLEAIPDTILRIERDGKIIGVKLGKDKFFNISGKVILGKNIKDIFENKFVELIKTNLSIAVETNKLISFEYNLKERNIEIEARIVQSGYEEVTIILRDITERKLMDQRLKYISSHDLLTGLYNRNYFEQEMVMLSGKQVAPIGLIVFDLDGLKIINDSFGHSAGDDLLRAFSQILKESFVEIVSIYRIGGDEFAVLLPNTSEIIVEQHCKSIVRRVKEYNKKHSYLPLNISHGFAVSNSEFADTNKLYREADDNMYREKLHQSTSARSAIVQALNTALEVRDFITQGHAERMQELAVKLAKSLGLTERRIADVKLLAKFHDIGKVGIQDRILFKQGILNEEEFEEMKRHSEIGYRIAKSIPVLIPIAGWILKHHEWWNGKGYPLGLKEEEIPLECRILAIVDAYDAMTNDRPYRNAMSFQEAIEELIQCAGIQFDPILVRRFIDILMKEHNYQIEYKVNS